MEVSKAEILDAQTRIQAFIKGHGREPNYVELTDRNTHKTDEIPIEQVNGLFFNIYNFLNREERFPNFATVNIQKAEPTIWNHQNNKYNCCPATFMMASSKLFRIVHEKTAAQILGTTTSGTDPKNLVARAPAMGFAVKPIPRSSIPVRAALDSYKAVMVHYETGDAECSGFQNNYGHYALIKDTRDGDKYEVWDPTMGIFSCPFRDLDTATNGRRISYYTVELA